MYNQFSYKIELDHFFLASQTDCKWIMISYLQI